MVRLRLAALIGLLALVPAVAFFLSRGTVVTLALSVASVLVIVGSLWLMVGDAEQPTASPEP